MIASSQSRARGAEAEAGASCRAELGRCARSLASSLAAPQALCQLLKLAWEYQWRGSWMSSGALVLASSKSQEKEAADPVSQADAEFGGSLKWLHFPVPCSSPQGKKVWQ